ncbi:DNA repair protein RecN [Rasiella rasia]|uniref:DNA repair protein RecN n=1 Tax=Rasiella rasia TaxID=2744027 RepID=A0A6G6GQ54_9FLAO|nr:DNA repair protein RecN [Rasiella rasia]QIE60716.1 DNA repair protein RecN [Rasiella rasia]
MLTTLSIKNYALIEDVKVDFANGLTTITGETGAGKSILLGALSLLLGKRAEMSSVKDAAKKCVIEGEFLITDYGFAEIFAQLAFDYEDHTIIRREILPSGKSRAFVNDSPVNLSQLQQLGERLVDIHSQHETRSLLSEVNQLEVVDAVSGNESLLHEYRESLKAYRKLQAELAQLITEKETANKELDYHTFLYNELEEAKLGSIDQDELEETYEKLNNAETIQEGLAAALRVLADEPIGSIETAKEARLQFNKLKGFSSEYESLWERLNSVIIELEDISDSITNEADAIEADPSQLFQTQERLQTLYKLQQKHSAATVDELLAIEADLALKIETTSNLEQQIELLRASIESAKESLKTISEKIRKKRKEVLPQLREKLEFLLRDLGLPNANFQFNLVPVSEFKETGADSLQWLFSANKGVAPSAIQKVASGGELSRIMLSIKAVLAQHKKLPTLIFDEIDTGVSGEIAQQMASIMEQMSKGMQVFSITHLPQIAAKGNQQIKVYKEDVNDITVTQLKQLSEDERIVEIAQMIGGHTLTDSALAHARQLRN